MLVSVNWLKKFLPDIGSIDELTNKLTSCGFEVDDINVENASYENIKVGLILKKESKDALYIYSVTTNNSEELSIVSNLSLDVGDKLAVATQDSILCGEKFVVKTISNIVSYGLFCSYSSLGIKREVDEVITIPLDINIGTDISNIIKLDDTILDIDIMPNRGDVLSIYGIAREISALQNISINSYDSNFYDSKSKNDIRLNVDDIENCPYVCMRQITGIDNTKKTPLWIKESLTRSGVGSVSIIVDILNYVMLEIGQPMHAYDSSVVSNNINFRLAKKHETIELLNDKKIELEDNTYVVADDSSILSIAGIMGSEHSKVTSKTTNILIESAYFNANLIMGKARKYGLHTDSSYRFERGVEPKIQYNAIERVSKLIIDLCGGVLSDIDEFISLEHLPQTHVINFNKSNCDSLLGFKIDSDIIEDIFTKLGLVILEKNELWVIRVPRYRQDIKLEVDLIEEVIRLYGYENLPKISGKTNMVCKNITNDNTDMICDLLVSRDYNEVINYSFVSKLQEMIGKSSDISILNPLSIDNSIMRSSLWTGLLESLRFNLNHQKDRIKIFEIGLVFSTQDSKVLQERNIAGLLTGSCYVDNWQGQNNNMDFFYVKKDIEVMLNSISPLENFDFIPSSNPTLHPGKSADIIYNNICIGSIGQLNPAIQLHFDIAQEVYLFEVCLDKLHSKVYFPVIEMSKFPLVKRDLSFFIDKDINYSDISGSISKINCEFLKNVSIFDVYEGKNVPPGQKSIGLSFKLQHPKRTLIDKEVNSWIDLVIGKLTQDFSIKIRD